MRIQKLPAAIALAALLPTMALAVPFTTTNNVGQDDENAAQSIFSGGITDAINFETAANSTTGTTLSYNSTLDVPLVATFGGLTNGQTPVFSGNANGDGSSVESIGIDTSFPTSIAGGDFSFNTTNYSRDANGRYDSTPFVNAPGPVSVREDTNMVGTVLLKGHGVQRGGGFAGDTLREGFGAVTVVFDELVSGFGGYVGSLETVGSVMLITFGADGAELARVTSVRDEFSDNAGLGAFDLLAIEDQAGENIIKAATFVQIDDDELGFNLDYVIFERQAALPPQPPQVPVPASLLLLLVGMSGLIMRRKIS